MYYLDLALPSPAGNLACDEALLDACEADGSQVLRFWQPADYFVVVGYANKVALEVDETACAEAGVPVLRRCSGGGTVLQGPGCLNYSVILRFDDPASPLATITGANRFILDRIRHALEPLTGQPVEREGDTDLVIGGRKFSGNAQRRRRTHLLFHGTFLLKFDLPRIARCLRMPSKQPKYRDDRSHLDFLANLPLSVAAVKRALSAAWDAREPLPTIPRAAIKQLVLERYSTEAWNRKL